MSGARQRGVFSNSSDNNKAGNGITSKKDLFAASMPSPEESKSAQDEPVTANTDIATNDKPESWISLMWKNFYVFLFVCFSVLLTIEIIHFRDIIDSLSDSYDHDGAIAMVFIMFGCMIPPAVIAIICYKGFYQFWKDYKTGKTR